MLLIYDKNGVAHVIRPCPLVSINYSANKNKARSLGGTYNITLNGTLLARHGSPEPVNKSAPHNGVQYDAIYADPRPSGYAVSQDNALGSILEKQNAIRSLFAVDGQRMELLSISGDEPIVVFYPSVVDISFEEGTYVDLCRYTVSLRSDVLFDKDDNIINDGLMNLNKEGDLVVYPTDEANYSNGTPLSPRKSLQDHISDVGGLVEDFTDTWAIEPEDGNGITTNPFANDNRFENVVRTYRITRNISATGKTIHGPHGGVNKRFEAWEQARGFIQKRLGDTYPMTGLKLSNYFASGLMDIAYANYGGYNHSRTENIDKTGGVYSVSETWLLSSGTAYETYNMSIATSLQSNPTFSINGVVRGLSSIPPSGTIYGGVVDNNINTPFENAMIKYDAISNQGNFGWISDIYKRVQNVTPCFVNPFPASISVGLNEFSGEVTYDIQFDSRPLSNIPGTVSEVISVNDTYPGDVFASIPVLGRVTGPVLQYLGTRTEYRRDVTIDLLFPPPSGEISDGLTTTLPPDQAIVKFRNQYFGNKPTLWEPARTQLNNVIRSLSPAFEVGIRKYFINPPTENWNPQERRYSLNLSWTYELDH